MSENTRSLRVAYSMLRSKLGNPYSVETLISVTWDHFPLDSTQTKREAEAAVVKCHYFFGDSQYLSPYGLYDSDGVDVPDRMHQLPRSANVCFLETKFDLPLANMGKLFTATQCSDLTYFLHLPQSLAVNIVCLSENPTHTLSSSSSN